MHRYQPRFHIVYLIPNNIKEERDYLNFRAFNFPETSFTAVTAYQNQRVSLHIFEKSYESWGEMSKKCFDVKSQ